MTVGVVYKYICLSMVGPVKSFFGKIACSLFAQSLHATIHTFVHGLLHAICLFLVIEFELQVLLCEEEVSPL